MADAAPTEASTPAKPNESTPGDHSKKQLASEPRPASTCDKIWLSLGVGVVAACFSAAAYATLFLNSSGGVSLTKKTWDSHVEGKQVFVMFQAPW